MHYTALNAAKRPQMHSRYACLVVGGYTAALLLAEVVGAYRDPLIAIMLHALLLTLLVSHSVQQPDRGVRHLLLGLALLPLLRIVSLTLITSLVPTVYLYGLMALPLAAAIFLVARVQKLRRVGMGLQRIHGSTAWLQQLAIAASGIPLSVGGFWLLHPTPLINGWALAPFIVAALVLTICGALVEETLFRGLLQQVAQPVFGKGALLFSALLYTISYLSWQSIAYVGAALGLGLFFGWCVKRTGSIWGVVAAHSLINIGMLLVWPLLF